MVALMQDEVLIALDCDPLEFTDPEARAAIKEVSRQLETAGIPLTRLVQFRNGGVMAAASMSLGPYLVPVASIVASTLAGVLTAWIKAPRRKIRIKMGDTQIEAASVEEVERLMSQVKEFQAKASRKKSSA